MFLYQDGTAGRTCLHVPASRVGRVCFTLCAMLHPAWARGDVSSTAGSLEDLICSCSAGCSLSSPEFSYVPDRAGAPGLPRLHGAFAEGWPGADRLVSTWLVLARPGRCAASFKIIPAVRGILVPSGLKDRPPVAERWHLFALAIFTSPSAASQVCHGPSADGSPSFVTEPSGGGFGRWPTAWSGYSAASPGF